jgi:hypothetical protein
MRIYLVKHGATEHLVEANAPSQAVMHVAAGLITAAPAKPADVVRAMMAGAKLETVGSAQAALAGV